MNVPRVTRRQFIRQATCAGAVAATAGTVVMATRRFARQRGTTAIIKENPFAYEVGVGSEIDPQLMAYAQVARFKVSRTDARRVAGGPDDRIYVAAGNYVSVLDTSGATLNEIALASAARALAVDDGVIYVGLRDRIEVFNSKGQRQSSWDSATQRSWFTGIAIGGNDLFIADAGARVILRYDRSGKFIRRIGEKDSARNIPGFIIPSPYFDVKLAGDGLLRVTNPGRHQVEAYTREGDFEFAWGKTTTAIEGFCGCCNPIGIALLAGDHCVTCEKGLPRVKVYSARGELQSVVAGPDLFTSEAPAISDESAPALDVAVDSRGRVVILDLSRNEIRVMEPKAIV